MAGRGSLAGLMPYGDANAIVMEMAARGAAGRPATRRCWPASAAPTRSGSCRGSSTSSQATGFAGVQNFPTVGLIDGVFRQNLEETGMGFDLEVDMIRPRPRAATCSPRPYVFDAEQAAAMAEAGADILVPHVGLTTKGTIGATTALTLDEAVERVQAMPTPPTRSTPTSSSSATAARSPSPPTPQYVLDRTEGVVGFFGASSMERLPTERAIAAQVRRSSRAAPGLTGTFAQLEEDAPCTATRRTRPPWSSTGGRIKWLVSPSAVDGATSSFGEVVINPDKGHERHGHPDADEVLYVIEGTGRQTVGDGARVRRSSPATRSGCRRARCTPPSTPAGSRCA